MLSQYLKQIFPNNLVPIVVDYYTPHYNKTEQTFKGSHISTIIGLTNNRFATGSTRGTISIYNLLDNTIIIKKIDKTIISSICQIDENTVACGTKQQNYILIWNFKNNKSKKIYYDGGCMNMISLNNNILAFISNCSLFTMNIKNNSTRCQIYPMPVVTCISVVNNKMLIGFDFRDMSWNRLTEIFIIERADIISNNNWFGDPERLLIKDDKYVSQIVPTENNNIIIVKDVSMESSSIAVNNIDTGENIRIIDKMKGRISNVVYLRNNYIAVLIERKVLIFNIITGEQVQTFKQKKQFIAVVGDKIITVDYNSNIEVYEKLM
jgi:hypothetical protein